MGRCSVPAKAGFEQVGGWRILEVGWGGFPLGGGNDGGKGAGMTEMGVTGVGAGGGEIPAASAGMTETGAGMREGRSGKDGKWDKSIGR